MKTRITVQKGLVTERIIKQRNDKQEREYEMTIRQTKRYHRSRKGFTLIELVIVIAILAVIAGAVSQAYSGLDERANRSQAAFNMKAVDKGVRTFRVVNGVYPNNLDLLTVSDTAVGSVVGNGAATATAGGFFTPLTRELEGSDANKATSDGLLHFFPATAAIADALAESGITSVRGVVDANDIPTAFEDPNRGFDRAPSGVGADVAVGTGLVLPIVQSRNLGAADSSVLQEITQLDSDTTHVVVALGLGNNASIVSDEVSVNAANFSDAPFYGGVASSEYGRFILLFHVASDTDGNDTIEDGEVFNSATFVGVLDSDGNHLDRQVRLAKGDTN